MVSFGLKLPYIIAAIALVKASSVTGIAPEKRALYQPLSDGNWQCLDGSKVISFSAINDDYCDCPDGSDEPGTSACPNGVFYCENKGHIASYIKSSSVHDGVCDEQCCDGTDEKEGDCPNRCGVVGEQYRKRQETERAAAELGLKTKRQWIEEAQTQINVWQEKKTKLEDSIVLKKGIVNRLERELKALESKAQKTKRSCPSCVEELSTLKNDVSILQDELETLKNILGDMKRDHNHNFHDMAVKSAISGYDEFMSRYDQIKADIEEDIKDVEEKESKFENLVENVHEDEKSVVNVCIETLEPYLPEFVKSTILDKWLTKDHSEASVNEGDVDKARKAFDDAESELDQLNNDLDKVNKELDFDYGKEKEWLQLKDVCIEKNEGEYTYSLCFLGDAYQKSNKDNARTHLGKFSKFDGIEQDKYKKHHHNQGARCWNGPERSVKAVIECGVKNEILEVSEPEKCEYLYRVVSPSVCEESTRHEIKKPIHEEL